MIERAIYSWVFGLNFTLDHITITPCVPKEYANAEITTSFDGRRITIKYICYGAKITSAEVNGKNVPISADTRSVMIDKSLFNGDLNINVKLEN